MLPLVDAGLRHVVDALLSGPAAAADRLKGSSPDLSMKQYIIVYPRATEAATGSTMNATVQRVLMIQMINIATVRSIRNLHFRVSSAKDFTDMLEKQNLRRYRYA